MDTHQIQISEPWDFEHQNGTNVFGVRLVDVIEMPPKENWQPRYLLLDVSEPFEFEGETVTQLLCCPRYEGDSIWQARHIPCVVGISRIFPGIRYNHDSEVKPDELAYFAIGEIRAHNKVLQRIMKSFAFLDHSARR
jgi:hypothetical protein